VLPQALHPPPLRPQDHRAHRAVRQRRVPRRARQSRHLQQVHVHHHVVHVLWAFLRARRSEGGRGCRPVVGWPIEVCVGEWEAHVLCGVCFLSSVFFLSPCSLLSLGFITSHLLPLLSLFYPRGCLLAWGSESSSSQTCIEPSPRTHQHVSRPALTILFFYRSSRRIPQCWGSSLHWPGSQN